MLRTILKPFSFVPALLLMYMIFSFSAQEGDVSAQLSYKVSVKIVETADYIFDANLDYYQIDEWANKINFITRKLAHMAEYFALAVAVSFPLYVYGMHGILLMFIAGLICVAFACGDEYHQSFVMGRSPSAKDVCIDSIGIFFGIIMVRIIGWTGRKTIFRPKKKKRNGFGGRKKKARDDYYDDYYEVPPQNMGYPGYPMPPQNGGYQAPPKGNGYYQMPPQNGDYQVPPKGNGYYQMPPQSGGYQAPPKSNKYYQMPPKNGGYPQTPSEEELYYQAPPAQNTKIFHSKPQTARTSSNPMDPYWEPEKEIDFNLKPEYPEREYQEQDDPYDNDWGFEEPQSPYPVPEQQQPHPEPPQPAPQQPHPVPEQPYHTPQQKRKKKKPKKDWFFDM